MAYLDDLETASLDGVEFLYETVNNKGGRRVLTYEFPGKDVPHTEDMGKKARSFSLNAFLIGDDSHVRARQLETLLDRGGVMRFVHPLNGTFQVKLAQDGWSSTIDHQKAGIVKFSFSLIESGAVNPPAVAATSAGLAPGAAALRRQDQALPTPNRTVLSTSIAGILSGTRAAFTALNQLNAKITAATGVIDTVTVQIAAATREVEDLLNQPNALKSQLHALGFSIFNALTVFDPTDFTRGPLPDLPAVMLGGLLSSSTFDSLNFVEEIAGAPLTADEVGFHADVTLSFRMSVLLGAVEALPALQFNNSSQALKLLRAFEVSFNTVTGGAVLDSSLEEPLRTLLQQVQAHLISVSLSEPDLTKITVRSSIPAVVLAYKLYGDPERDEEILRRNNLRQPMHVVGELSILGE